MGCVNRRETRSGQNLTGGLSALWEPIVLSQPPYLSRGQSCPSFLPGAWALADSCNPRDLLVWPALHCMPAAEALLPACLSWGPGKGRKILSRPLPPVSESCSPWEKPPDPRGQICFLPTSSSVRRRVQSKARARNPSHLAWMPRCWQLRAGICWASGENGAGLILHQ